MKYKIAMVSIFLGVGVFLAIMMKEKDESKSSSQVAYDYYLADNESKMWDDMVAGGALPEYNTLPPSTVDFDSLVEKSSLIKEIVPYYPMGFGIENMSSKVTFASDSGSKEVVFPYRVSDSLTFQNIIFRPYTDESVFLSAVDVEKIDDVEDGAYITENILKNLGLNKSRTLELTGTVYVPIKASMEDETLTYTNPDTDEQSTRDVSAYHVAEYLQMEYTIPVKGVIKSSSPGYSYLDTAEIVLPQSQMAKLFSRATKNVDEVTWKPNTYILRLNKKCDPKTLSLELSHYMDDFILLGVPYGDYDDLFLYQAGDKS